MKDYLHQQVKLILFEISAICSANSSFFSVITANQTKMDQANERFAWWLSKILSIPEDEQTAKQIRKFYFGSHENIASKKFIQNYTNLLSDRFFMVATYQHAKLYSNHAPIRLYYYTHEGDFCLGHIMAASQGPFPFIVNVLFDTMSRWFRTAVLNEKIQHMGTIVEKLLNTKIS